MAGERILVVDDSALDLAMARDILVDGGYKVDTAESAEEALEKFESAEYGLIITDLVMPGMSGTDLASELKKRKRDGPRVVLVTAEEKFKSTDTASTLQKPFTKASLLTAAQMLCKPAAKPDKPESAVPTAPSAPTATPAPSSFKRQSQARRSDAPAEKSWFKKLFS